MRNPMRAYVGEEIKKSVQKQNINYSEMAEDTSVNRKTLSSYVTNERKAPFETIMKMVDYLKDSNLSDSMAHVFFKTPRMFSTQKWSQENQENVYALLEMQRIAEKKRINFDEKAIEDMFAAKNRKQIRTYSALIELEISVEKSYKHAIDETYQFDPDEIQAEIDRMLGGN